MRYVIIGGAGFVGQELVQLLFKQNEKNIVVMDIVPSPQAVQYVKQDITKEIDFQFMPDDIVVHLAANQYHHKVPKKNRKAFFENVNAFGTKNILQKMEKDGAHQMIFFSTDMVYGKPQYLPVDIQHPQNPFGFYGKSKKMAEDICAEFRQKGMNITIFRPRMIIGKGRLGILIKLFKLIEHSLPVPMIGNGRNCYQMVSVIDCAKAIYAAVRHGLPNKAYNLGSTISPPHTISVRDLLKTLIIKNHSKSILLPTWGKGVKMVLGLMGALGLEIMYKEQYMIADENYIIDISETQKDLGWQPQFNDEDMMLAAFNEFKRLKRKRL